MKAFNLRTWIVRNRKLVRVGAIAASAVLVLGTAQAALKIRLTDVGSATTIVITDQDFIGPPPDANPVAGVVSWAGTLGVFTVNVTTGLSKPVIGGPNDAFIDLLSFHIASGGAGTMVVEMTDTGFVMPAGGSEHTTLVGGTLAGGASVSFASYVDVGNAEFGVGNPLFMGPFGPGAYSASTASPIVLGGGPFSMTQAATFVASAGGSTSFDMETHVTPEPSSLAMLVPGLAPLGLIIKRRRSKKA